MPVAFTHGAYGAVSRETEPKHHCKRIALKDDGSLLQADPSEDSAPKPITKATLEGSALHITVAGGFEFTVTLKDNTHAEIHPVGAPPYTKPIPAEKVHNSR